MAADGIDFSSAIQELVLNLRVASELLKIDIHKQSSVPSWTYEHAKVERTMNWHESRNILFPENHSKFLEDWLGAFGN
ncbi:hypothetical protein BCON_0206g00050 [Botryotinia convoluta]|uniref:Uncharacterized protein n=1 Tax=Botryotinia convoluta TaxID=54673 RepID=A0A4Z1HS92_9HELO|nr:hypothetical protein BCON_0206g00050 [Botryotinia convoluta]